MASSQGSKKILIFSVNDVYEIDHLGRLSQFIKRTVAEQRPAKYFVTLAGDFLSPYLLSCIDKGKNMVKLMNQAGFSHVCLGNHEFDMSVKVLVDRLAEMKFKVINSNIRPLKKTIPNDVVEIDLGEEDDDDFDGQTGTDEAQSEPKAARDPFRIGFVGFCTEKTKRLCNNVPYDIKIDKINEVAPLEIEKLRKMQGCDFVIALTHQDAKYDEDMASREDVNLVIGGHDHVKIIERFHNDKHKRDVFVVKCGMDATTVGVTTIVISDDATVLTSALSHVSSPAVSHSDPTSPTNSSYEWHLETGEQTAPNTPQPGPSHHHQPGHPRTSGSHSRAPSSDESRAEDDFESSFQPILLHADPSPHGARKMNDGVISYCLGDRHVHIQVHTVEITDKALPTDPVVEDMIDRANQIVHHVESQYLVSTPLPNRGVRSHTTEFATYVLTKVRDWNHVDAVLAPAGIFKGKLDYMNGFRIADLHNELKWDEFLLLKMPAEVIEEVIAYSRSQGENFRGFMQTDDGITIDELPSVPDALGKIQPLKFKIQTVNNKPIEQGRKYFVLVSRSCKVDSNTKMFNPPLSAFIKRTRDAAPLRRRHSAGQLRSSTDQVMKPKRDSGATEAAARRDLHHHHHERPTVVETIIAALITTHWKTLFGPISYSGVDSFLGKTEVLEHFKDESLVNAVFHTMGAKDGRIKREELHRALTSANSLPERRNPFFDESEEGNPSPNM